MVLEAKNALGRVPGLNEDLLDTQGNYFDKGDMFWIAVDKHDRVIDSIGYNSCDKNSAVLHRLFVKCSLKHHGIATSLLYTAEEFIREIGKDTIYVNLGIGEEWFESRNFYAKHKYVEYQPNRLKKNLLYRLKYHVIKEQI